MTTDPGNGGVTFTVKELLAKLDAKLDLVVERLDEKVNRKDFDALAQRVTTIETENRLDKERVNSAAAALAAETERRRAQAEQDRVARAAALEVPVRAWGLRANKAAVISVCFIAVSITLSFLALTHRI